MNEKGGNRGSLSFSFSGRYTNVRLARVGENVNTKNAVMDEFAQKGNLYLSYVHGWLRFVNVAMRSFVRNSRNVSFGPTHPYPILHSALPLSLSLFLSPPSHQFTQPQKQPSRQDSALYPASFNQVDSYI